MALLFFAMGGPDLGRFLGTRRFVIWHDSAEDEGVGCNEGGSLVGLKFGHVFACAVCTGRETAFVFNCLFIPRNPTQFILFLAICADENNVNGTGELCALSSLEGPFRHLWQG